METWMSKFHEINNLQGIIHFTLSIVLQSASLENTLQSLGKQ